MVGSSLSELEKRNQRQQETQYRGCKTCGDQKIINMYVHTDLQWMLHGSLGSYILKSVTE